MFKLREPSKANKRRAEIITTQLSLPVMEKMEIHNKNRELKHLGFVRVAAIKALVCMSNLYETAKQNSGPLRSAVGTVEGTVTTIVGSVYEKFKGVPDYLLLFLDKKVDQATCKFEKHAPHVAKHAVSHAQYFIQIASQKAQKLVYEAQAGGPRAAVYFAAAESKHLIISQSIKAWIKLNKYPPVHTVADLAIPTAAHCSEKYNHIVKDMTQKGYKVFVYLPLVPIEEISKAFKEGEAEKEVANGHKEDSDSSD